MYKRQDGIFIDLRSRKRSRPLSLILSAVGSIVIYSQLYALCNRTDWRRTSLSTTQTAVEGSYNSALITTKLRFQFLLTTGLHFHRNVSTRLPHTCRRWGLCHVSVQCVYWAVLLKSSLLSAVVCLVFRRQFKFLLVATKTTGCGVTLATCSVAAADDITTTLHTDLTHSDVLDRNEHSCLECICVRSTSIGRIHRNNLSIGRLDSIAVSRSTVT